MTLYPNLIREALATVRYPGTGKNIIEAGMLDDNMRINGSRVSFSLIFPKNPDPFMKSVLKAAEAAIKAHCGQEVEVEITALAPEHAPKTHEKLLPSVRHIIAVSSGKGGVGKSTVAANLAVALAAEGYKVGLLDADIFGPSLPTMFHLEDFQPYGEMVGNRQMIVPAERYGVKMLSIGFFVRPEQATVWRGPMASNALKQLISECNWGDLDYFVIDTPPGTSDIHLTLLQELNVSGAVIVSTPQKVALADARKGIDMYRNKQIGVPILGLVENMAWFTPAELPDHKYYIFGREGVDRLAKEMNIPVLGRIPLVQSICESGDRGEPVAVNADTVTGQAFRDLANHVADAVEELK